MASKKDLHRVPVTRTLGVVLRVQVTKGLRSHAKTVEKQVKIRKTSDRLRADGMTATKRRKVTSNEALGMIL